MVILETAIIFHDQTLVDKLFPAGKGGAILDRDIRNSFLLATLGLAKGAFHDQIKTITIGDYNLIMISREIQRPSTQGSTDNFPIYVLTISDKDTNRKDLLDCMQDCLDQFLNRFTLFDIFEKKIAVFQEFQSRFDKIFELLLYNPVDRMKSIF